MEMELPNVFEVKHEIEDVEPDLTDEELELPVPVTLPDNGADVLEEELELPVPVILPDNGADVLEAEILQDPLVDIPGSWICNKVESILHCYNPQEISPNSFSSHSSQILSYDIQGQKSDEESSLPTFSPESLEDPLSTDTKEQWIEEAKQKVELHIQEVRRRRKLRDSDVSTESRSNKYKERNRIMMSNLVIVPRMQRITDMPIPSSSQRKNMKHKVTKKLPAPSIPKYNLKPRPRPAVTHGEEWDQWVLEEKARLEQHILEVRQSRKRRVEETHIHKNSSWHVIQTMPLKSSQLDSQGSNNQASEIRSTRSTHRSEENVQRRGKNKRRGRGRGKRRSGKRSKRTTNVEESSETVADHAVSETFSCPDCRLCFHSEMDLKEHPCIEQHVSGDVLLFCQDNSLTFANSCDFNNQETLSVNTEAPGEVRELNVEIVASFCSNKTSCTYPFNVEPDLDVTQQGVKFEICEGMLPTQSYLTTGTCETQMYREILAQKEETHLVTKSRTIDRPFKCQVCSKSFRQKNNMLVHRRVHTGEKPYHCRACDKSFSDPSNLGRHQRNHINSSKPNHLRKHKCNLCDQSFTQAYNLRRHQRIHNNEFPYKCNECEKEFNRQCSLTDHILVNHEKQSCECHYCGKVFTQPSTLAKHLRLQCGENQSTVTNAKLRCKICDKKFLCFSELERHMRKHTGETPFVCGHCEKRFSQKSNLKVHIRYHHREFINCTN